MAGTFKKFIAGLAVESLSTATFTTMPNSTRIDVIPYKATDGTNYNNAWSSTSSSNGKYQIAKIPYVGLTPVATSDKLEDYSLNDYLLSNAVGTTTCTRSQTINLTGSSLVYAVTVTAGASDITVKCIKFTKALNGVPDGSTAATDHTALVCGYYLETPLTITAGTSQTINVAFTVGEMSIVS